MKNFNGTFKFQVSFEQKPEKEINLAGFLFYCNGIFLQKQYVKEDVLEFNLEDTRDNSEQILNLDPKQLRLFITPVADQNIDEIKTIEQLESFKPYEPVLNTDANGNFQILPIPISISQFWPFCNCRVTGKVSKWFHVGQTWQDRDICNARVHICDIDTIWYWIYRIPDYIIAKIPQIILRPEEVIKFPIPIPDPAPFFKIELRSQKAQSQNIFNGASIEETHFNAINKLPELNAEIKQNFASGNLNLIRETIANNYAILHPWFCLVPILWPYFYRCRELAVVYTDANGRFDTNVIYNCFGDKPDIYIWIEYKINGVWTTVYNPPIPCYTFWDYNCGSNINIHITDERVPGDCCCNCPVPGELVWVKSISKHTSVAHIQQQASVTLLPPPGQLQGYDRIGLTDASADGDDFTIPVGDFRRPFGGTPSFYMCFGSDLPNSGIAYYRWSYKQVYDAQLNAPATADSYKPLMPIGGSVTKGYHYEYFDSHGARQSAPNSVTLGTFGINNNLYKIPPTSPAMAPFNVTESNPEWDEPIHDMNTITFDSAQLKNGSMPGGDGLYEFKLELFDQSGNLITNVQRDTFKISEYNNIELSINATDDYLENHTAFTASAFNMLMRIDNSKCLGGIYKVKVNGEDAEIGCCGFAHYKPNGAEADLELSFLASHPNNFATFNFSVVKGTCGGVPVANASGMVIDSTYTSLSPLVITSYQLNSLGVYEKHFTPEALLGNCYDDGTGKAAFAETLYVKAMATDGVNRVSAHDASYVAPVAYPVAAFALEP